MKLYSHYMEIIDSYQETFVIYFFFLINLILYNTTFDLLFKSEILPVQFFCHGRCIIMLCFPV